MDFLNNLQSIFFKEVSREEAMKAWHDENNHSEIVILWDDLTESCVDGEERFEEDKEQRFGITYSEMQIETNKCHAYDELYKKT